jgi:hypothetical protein
MMDLKDKYLDRIADALEEQMGVSPKLIGGNVLKPNIYRIADALDPEPTPLQDGTLKNPLARIAEVIESGEFGGGGTKEDIVTVGDLPPDNSIGKDYSFYTYNNKLYVKTNGFWKYIGLYNQGTLPYIPEIGMRRYFVSDKTGDTFRVSSKYWINNNQDGNVLLVFPAYTCDISDILDMTKDSNISNDCRIMAMSKNVQIVDQTIASSATSRINIKPADVYDNNILLGTFNCFTFDLVLTPSNNGRITAELIEDGTSSRQKYEYTDYSKDSTTRYAIYNNEKYIVRLVDDTVIQAFYQFVLN